MSHKWISSKYFQNKTRPSDSFRTSEQTSFKKEVKCSRVEKKMHFVLDISEFYSNFTFFYSGKSILPKCCIKTGKNFKEVN